VGWSFTGEPLLRTKQPNDPKIVAQDGPSPQPLSQRERGKEISLLSLWERRAGVVRAFAA
jgi:hypothetical protein